MNFWFSFETGADFFIPKFITKFKIRYICLSNLQHSLVGPIIRIKSCINMIDSSLINNSTSQYKQCICDPVAKNLLLVAIQLTTQAHRQMFWISDSEQPTRSWKWILTGQEL